MRLKGEQLMSGMLRKGEDDNVESREMKASGEAVEGWSGGWELEMKAC